MQLSQLLRNLLLVYSACVLMEQPCVAQFAPAAGQPGSTAIHKDSSILVTWASSCIINRGPVNCSDPLAPLASFGSSAAALGMADGLDVVSLGDGGSALLDFSNQPFTNGSGWDFAVFENGFDNYFLELATVEVSSDGIHFVLFPPTSNTPDHVQTGTFDSLDASLLNNLAGKYRNRYGVPFDLDELAPDSILNKDTIRFIRIKDVCGCIDCPCATADHGGRIINDPFPTPFPECGFDLDAVGIIHPLPLGNEKRTVPAHPLVYPNPMRAGDDIVVRRQDLFREWQLSSADGKTVKSSGVDAFRSHISELSPGMYILKNETGISQTLIITP